MADQERVVIGALDGGLRGDPWAGALAVHVDERRRVAKVDDNSGTGAYVSYQLPREPPIVFYLVHISHVVLTKRRCRRHAVVRQPFRSDRVSWKRLKHQPRWSRPARCRTALMRHPSSALTKRYFERARCGYNKFTFHHPSTMALDPAIAFRSE